MATVGQWTGHEARALRKAMRLSMRAFAARMGVSVRTITKWETGGRNMIPRPESQSMLDAALGLAAAEVRWRFEILLSPEQSLGNQLAIPGPRRWDFETWAEDLDRVIVNLSRQSFASADRLLNRWLTKFEPQDLDSRGLYLYARSLVLLGDLKRDQGLLTSDAAPQAYGRAMSVFKELDIPRRVGQIELSLAVVAEMSGKLNAAAKRYDLLAADGRLSGRDRARAALWVGTALSKAGRNGHAARIMLPAVQQFEILDEPDDWSVAQQKLALAHRGAGNLDRALFYIDIARRNGMVDAPMQRVRLDTAHAHILLSDKATWDNGLQMLDKAAQLATQFGLSHQLNAIAGIRTGFERAAGGRT